MSNTKTIAKNTGWYSVENIVSAVVTVITSIAIARTLGPTKTGYIVYVSYVASVVGNLGSLGIPAATRKYMAEFIGMGDKGTARLIFFRTLALQAGLASLATLAIILWVFQDANAQFRLAAVLIALSIWPSMVNSVPAQANSATENLATNVPGSIVSAFVYLFAILATVIFHWGVTGIGAALLLMRVADFLVRFFPTLARISAWNATQVLPDGLRKRMVAYAWQSVATMLLALIVWERCEVLLLKSLCADIRQVAFYSIAFTFGNYLLLSSTIFGAAASTTVFAQHGRDKSRMPQLAAASFRYLALTSIPLHFIAVALALPALLLLYGNRYAGAAMVVTVAPLLCMPKAFLAPIQSLLQSAERQGYVILATVVAGIVDIGVAWTLIPAHGAVGACIGNGVAQITAVGIMWTIGIRLFHVRLPWMFTAKIAAASAAAGLCAHFVAATLPPLWGSLLGGCVSLLVLLVLTYLLRVLEPQDRDRLAILTSILPWRLGKPVSKLLSLLVRCERTPMQRQLAE
jgi:O-antigen/teichoic acid export membrane protein